jgi:hypothetical protein
MDIKTAQKIYCSEVLAHKHHNSISPCTFTYSEEGERITCTMLFEMKLRSFIINADNKVLVSSEFIPFNEPAILE